MLGSIEQAQVAALQFQSQMGAPGLLVSPDKIYNLQAKKAVLAGFKDPGQFWNKPPPNWQPPQPPPPVELQIAQMKMQTDQQNEQGRMQAKVAGEQAKADAQKQIEAAQMASDMQTAQFEAKLEYQLKLVESQFQERIKAMQESFNQQTEIRIAEIRAMAQVEAARITKGYGMGQDMVSAMAGDLGIPQAADPLTTLASAIQGFTAAVSQPKEIMRDAQGRATGLRPMNGSGAAP